MRMEHEIHAVLFDLDGTLLDRRRSFELFVRKQRERFVSSLGVVDSDRYVQTLVRLDRDGYGPREELFTGLVSEFDLPPPLATDLLVDYRAGFRAPAWKFSTSIRSLTVSPACRASVLTSRPNSSLLRE
jgi:FMN phosphatase YigB (HAD superfamily)